MTKNDVDLSKVKDLFDEEAVFEEMKQQGIKTDDQDTERKKQRQLKQS